MGFQTPLYELSDYLDWTTSGKIQLPDFQRGYKWDDERIRSLLMTILRGHPLGVVMLLKTGNDQIRFKPRAVEGVDLPANTEADLLLLDGQQRLTSLTQALTGSGVVSTKDDRGKLMDRKYYVHIPTALLGEDHIDDAVKSMPGDGVERTNFGKDVVLDVSTPDLERAADYFPVSLLFGDYVSWIFEYDKDAAKDFHQCVIKPAGTYNIPAIELDTATSKAAVATVFEKVNTGGLGLNVFELLTATFAGDPDYFAKTGNDFRLNEDWVKTQKVFAAHGVLSGIENTDFVQAVSLLTTLAKAKADTTGRPPAVSARKEDLLRLTLTEYLQWVEPLREAFTWCATFLADEFIFDHKFLPYPKQLVPLAVIKVLLGPDADLHSVRQRISQWFWCGILGELYGSTIETRFARDVEQVPGWARDESPTVPKTVTDCSFVASRLISLRTRNAAAYKGVYALILSAGAKDWMYDKSLDKVQYTSLAVDIHHVFPYAWCLTNQIEPSLRESIVNKTPLSAATNRAIGGAAPSQYIQRIEKKAGLTGARLDDLLETHSCNPIAMRADDFDSFFMNRLATLAVLIEKATGRPVVNDIDDTPSEAPDAFDPEDEAVKPDLEDIETEVED